MMDRLTPIRNALVDLQQAIHDASLLDVDLPEDIRWELHVLAASMRDYTFWVQRVDGGWKATEVESGVSGAVKDGVEAALYAYFNREYS